MVVLIALCVGVEFLCCQHLMCFHIFSLVWVAEWPPIGKMAAHSAYNMFS